MQKVVLLLALGVALLLSACATSPAPATGGETVVEASDFKFQPSSIGVKVGQAVKLRFRNKGRVEHDFGVMEIPLANMSAPTPASGGHDMSGMAQEPQLHVPALAGQSNMVQFTPSQAGNYQILCTVAGHKEAGMVATLIVK